MVKAPRAGRVKTRLSADIGAGRATAFYRHAVAHLTTRLGSTLRWRTVLAVAPDTAVGLATWPKVISSRNRVGQGGGGLGGRMARVFKAVRQGPVVMIGSDAVAVEATDIASAFTALAGHDVVLGPAPDGGYWLVGVAPRVDVDQLFAGVCWSSEHTFRDTVSNAHGLRVAELRTLTDIDTGQEFADQNATLGRLIVPNTR